MSDHQKQRRIGPQLRLTVVLLLLALVSITAASYAWFRLATNTRVGSMSLELTTGANLRFDVQAHSVFEDYQKTLTFDDLAAQILREQRVDVKTTELEPVTSTNGTTFSDEEGAAVTGEKGEFWTFTLHFMATEDMVVHLTSDNTEGKQDGTLLQSETGAAPAMRVSFTADGKTAIYQAQGGGNGTFTLAPAGQMVYNESNALFSLTADTDKEVQLCVWMEGEDHACTDELRGSDFQLRMRFAGTDDSGTLLE